MKFDIFQNRLELISKFLTNSLAQLKEFYLSWAIGQWDMLSPGTLIREGISDMDDKVVMLDCDW